MRFSVIIPFKRGTEYLRDCITSLKEQCEDGYRDFEVLIIPDRPEDDVQSIVEEYGNGVDVRIIPQADAEGVAAARNAGLDKAEGDYIYFLDSDDFLLRGALKSISDQIDREGAKDVIYGRRIRTWYSKPGFEATYKGVDEPVEPDGYVFKEAFIDRYYAGATGDRLQAKHMDIVRSMAAEDIITSTRDMADISLLGTAVRRNLFTEHSVRYPEQFRYYSDMPVVGEILKHATSFAKCEASAYVKRRHNDPINFPSLLQEKSDDRIHQLAGAYAMTVDSLDEGCPLRARFEFKLMSFFTTNMAIQMRRNEDNRWRGEWFREIRAQLVRIPRETVRMARFFNRVMVRTAAKGNAHDVYTMISVQLGLQMVGKCIISREDRVRETYFHIFRKKPVQENWIMFECFFGKSYGDNPKPIYEYLAQNYPGEYRLIWSMEDPRGAQIPYAHRTVKRGGYRYAYYLARCKYLVFNTKQINWWIKRDGQELLETWHGTPLKRLAFDMGDNFSAAPGYKKSIYRMTRDWDHLVAPNKFSSDVFRSCFMYDGHMLEYGYPRNDILHRPDRDELAAGIRAKLGIPADKKTILYAPTWRDDEFYEAGKYRFTLKLDLPKLKAALGDEYVILLRTHYYIADKLDVTGMEGFAYNLSKYNDIADIYLISDICITDYSSVFFDYANLRRPMLFYTYDIDKYRDMLRGFYFDMESTVPGPLLYTTEEVIDAIRNIGEVSERFAARYDEFYERFCGWEDGKAAENIVNDVIRHRN